MARKELVPEQLLICAILSMAVEDTSITTFAQYARSRGITFAESLQAVEWLLSGAELCFFAGLFNMDESFLRRELLITAGLADGTPRLGQLIEPHPKRPQSQSQPKVNTKSTKEKSHSPSHYAQPQRSSK